MSYFYNEVSLSCGISFSWETHSTRTRAHTRARTHKHTHAQAHTRTHTSTGEQWRCIVPADWGCLCPQEREEEEEGRNTQTQVSERESWGFWSSPDWPEGSRFPPPVLEHNDWCLIIERDRLSLLPLFPNKQTYSSTPMTPTVSKSVHFANLMTENTTTIFCRQQTLKPLSSPQVRCLIQVHFFLKNTYIPALLVTI